MKYICTLLLAAVMSMLGLAGGKASAFPVQAPSAVLSPDVSPLIIDVRSGGHGGGHHGGFHGRPGHNRPYYNNHRHYNGHRYYNGHRCNYYSNSCRYRYNGYYYPYRWWLGGVAVGTAVAVGNNASKHKNWCANKYRSYNSKTNTFVAKGGQVRKCVSPYRG